MQSTTKTTAIANCYSTQHFAHAVYMHVQHGYIQVRENEKQKNLALSLQQNDTALKR